MNEFILNINENPTLRELHNTAFSFSVLEKEKIPKSWILTNFFVLRYDQTLTYNVKFFLKWGCFSRKFVFYYDNMNIIEKLIMYIDRGYYQLLILRSRQRLDTKLIFPSPITGGLRDPSSVTRKLHRMQKRAEIPQIRFHDLRHSFATLSLEQGMDIKTVSHMLGHTDAGFTMNTYMHVTDTMQQTVATAMGNLVTEKENEKRNKIIQYTA